MRRGKVEVANLMSETYDKADDIKARSANRIAKARAKAQKEGKEPLPTGKTEIVVLMSYERSREGRPDVGYPALGLD